VGPVGFALRRGARTELFEAGILDVVQRIEEIRTPAAPPSGETPQAAPDTSVGAPADIERLETALETERDPANQTAIRRAIERLKKLQ